MIGRTSASRNPYVINNNKNLDKIKKENQTKTGQIDQLNPLSKNVLAE